MKRFISCLIVFIAFTNADQVPVKLKEPTGLGNGSLAAKLENKTIIKDGITRINTTKHRPALIMLSVEIIKNGNRTNNTSTRDGSEIFVVDGDKSEEISFFEPPKASPYFPRFSEISMKTLYLIVCMCLAILLLMIVKLLVSRRERKKDYDLVTKGEFDA